MCCWCRSLALSLPPSLLLSARTLIPRTHAGAVKKLHPDVADVALGTGAVSTHGPSRPKPALSRAQMDEEAESARQRSAAGAPASAWVKQQTAEIRQVRDTLRAARREAYGAELPLADADGFARQHGRRARGSRHSRPLSAHVGRVASGGAHVVDGELRAGSPGGGGGGGGHDLLRGEARGGGGGGGGERPRWVVPARGLQAKERMTARERVFQAELAAKRGHLSGGDASPSVMARKGLG